MTGVHVTQEKPPSTVSHGQDVVAHTRSLGGGEVVVVDGLPCTSLERTVVDCCLMMNYRQSLIIVDHALRKGASASKLWETCGSLTGRPGVAALRRALENADPRSESPGETLTRDLITRLRIEPPELQVEVPTSEGTYRIDLAWRERKLALEFDGKVKYFDYAPTDEVIYKERQRENALVEQGWKVIRIKWRDLFNEQEFKTRVLRALRRTD